MEQNGNGPYLGLLTLLSFAFSVIAAVIAIDMYALLRTGRFGSSWRVLIIASVMFSMLQVLRMVELFKWSALGNLQLSQVVELMFVMTLAYALFLQRRVFARAAAGSRRGESTAREPGPQTAEQAGHEEDLWPQPRAAVSPPRSRSWGSHARPPSPA